MLTCSHCPASVPSPTVAGAAGWTRVRWGRCVWTRCTMCSRRAVTLAGARVERIGGAR
jgi:hypothetical protein